MPGLGIGLSDGEVVVDILFCIWAPVTEHTNPSVGCRIGWVGRHNGDEAQLETFSEGKAVREIHQRT